MHRHDMSHNRKILLYEALGIAVIELGFHQRQVPLLQINNC